jgi:hypothetical protein
MYQKDSSDTSGSDNVTVEIISSSFTSSAPDPTTDTKLKVQNESSFILTDVKWGSKVVSSRLAPSESTTVDVTEGTGYLYFNKYIDGEGFSCRTQEVIAVTRDETTTQTITNNTVVVALDDTANIGPLGTIAPPVSSAAMTWSGDWTRVSDTIYTSNAIGHNANTIERLNITASGAGTITIQITASSSEYSDYGYASRLDTGVSSTGYQMQVSGTQVETYTYTVPAGSHWIQFMYEKDYRYTSGSDSVTVEIISTTFTTE